MVDIEPRNQIERIVLGRLREHGWEVLEARRHGVDLYLCVRVGETPGMIRFCGGYEIDTGVVRSQVSTMPITLRVDLGRPDGEPSRWAVWDHYDFPTGGGQHKARYCANVFHEAIGEGWASLSGCSLWTKQIWYSRYTLKTVETLLTRAEALAPGQDEDARREQIFKVQRDNFSAQSQRKKDMVASVVLLSLGALFAALLVVALVYAPDIGAAIAASVALGVLTLALGLSGLFTLLRLLRAPRQPVEGMDAIAQTLRGTRAFSEVTLTERKERDGLPVPVLAGGRLEVGKAPLTLSRLSARSPDHSLALEADLCRMTWPEGVSSDVRFVPDRWLTTQLSGDSAELAKLVQGPREERRHGVVRWTFTGEEIDDGTLEQQFLKVAIAMGVSGVPYR